MGGPADRSAWRDAIATALDLPTLALIIELVHEHEEQTGRRITATELLAALRRPGR